MVRRAHPPQADSGQQFLLEAHYYEGGARERPLGSAGPRPSWAPPGEFVGFRNEIALLPDDAAVEFARFLFEGHHITWIGVFRRSVDQVFGDRLNHAGVGVWLRETDVVDPKNLIISLAEFASAVAAGRIESIVSHANAFVGEKYLQKYLSHYSVLPNPLGGWPYSATPISETEFLEASGRNVDDAWEVAAEQVLRMSVLPCANSPRSRALIVVPSAPGGVNEAAYKAELKPIRRGFVSELLSALPAALMNVTQENAALAQYRIDAENQKSTMESELQTLRGSVSELRERNAELEREIDDNDILKRLTTLDNMLRKVGDRADGIDALVRDLRKDVSGYARASRDRGADPRLDLTHEPWNRPIGSYSGPSSSQPHSATIGWGSILIVFIAVLIFSLFFLLLWIKFS